MPLARSSRKQSARPAEPIHHLRHVFAGAAVFLLVVIAVPMFVSSGHSQTIAGADTGTQTAALISTLQDLQTKIAQLSNDIRGMRAGGGTTAVSSQALAEGMPSCLDTCRTRLSSCLQGQTNTTSTAGRVFAPSYGAAPSSAGGLDFCRTQANTCINSCRPQTVTTVSCEDRCAVALGGCLLSAGTNETKLTDCRTQDRRCIVTACRGGGADGQATNRIPSAVCREQCSRDLDICSAAAKYDTLALQKCQSTAQTCLQRICSVSDAGGSITPFVTPPGGQGGASAQTPPAQSNPVGQNVTISCENACTSTYNVCSQNAGGDDMKQQACNTSYGDCRGACLVQIGGGM